MSKKLFLIGIVLSGFASGAFAVPSPSIFWPNTPYPNTQISCDDAWKGRYDKNGFNLFNPTPNDRMRFFYTDLGGPTSYTIDAGHFAANFSPFGFNYNCQSLSGFDRTTHAYNFGMTQLKFGVLNNLDVEANYAGYRMIHYTDKSFFAEDHPASKYGFGNFELKGKYNLFGNDGGRLSAAITGDVDFPVSTGSFDRRDNYTGGPGLAVDYQTPCGFDCRLNGCMDLSDCGGTWTSDFRQSVSATHALIENTYIFGGFNSMVRANLTSDDRPVTPTFTSNEDHGYRLSAMAGIYYMPDSNLNVYLSTDYGIHNADSFGFRVGVNWRLGRAW